MGDFINSYGDELLIAWINNWIIHAIFTNPLSIFDSNLFYPFTGTLAYSDTFFTTSLLSLIPLKIIGQPISTFNFIFISSLVLVPFSLFILSWYLTKDYFSSILSGVLIQFAPSFLDKKMHLQILAVEWIPLSALFFILFYKHKKTKYLALSMFFFLLQTYNSFMPGYFLVFFFGVFLFYLYRRNKKFLRVFLNKSNITVILITFLLIFAISIPYYKISFTYNAVRDIRDAIHFAIQPEDLLYPNEHTRLQKPLLSLANIRSYPANAEIKTAYRGAVFSILCLLIIIYIFKTKVKIRPPFFGIFSFTALIGFLLSFGPFLHINRLTIHKPFPIPLPYVLLYYIAPGFKGFRNSARFEVMFTLFIVIAIAIMLTHILKRFPHSLRIVIYIVLIVGVIAEYNYPMKFQHAPQTNEFPPVYHWLATTPANSASITMPIYDWYMYGFAEELKREYYTTVNFRKTVNGYSGFAPPQWQKLVADLHKDFPNQTTIKTIKDLGVNYIIVDKKAYDTGFKLKQERFNSDSVTRKLKENPSLRLIKSFENYYVFEFIGE